MQLWHMLGRKINNLGRVVDGERNASMDAQKSGQKVTGAGISGQDELQSFFAETPVRNEKVLKVPVKGTIMSFFAKQQQKTPQSTNKAPRKKMIESAKKSSESRHSIALKKIDIFVPK